MKPSSVKAEFIRLRAEGASYAKICEELHISKATCTKWEREFSEQIDETKRAALAELCESYGMTKAARIRNLGEILGRIDEAIASVDLSKIDPAKLLDYKLKYTEALRAEYIGVSPAFHRPVDAEGILEALGDLLNRARAGEITAEQAQMEGAVLNQLLKAYENTEVKKKIDELERLIEGGIDPNGEH